MPRTRDPKELAWGRFRQLLRRLALLWPRFGGLPLFVVAGAVTPTARLRPRNWGFEKRTTGVAHHQSLGLELEPALELRTNRIREVLVACLRVVVCSICGEGGRSTLLTHTPPPLWPVHSPLTPLPVWAPQMPRLETVWTHLRVCGVTTETHFGVQRVKPG